MAVLIFLAAALAAGAFDDLLPSEPSAPLCEVGGAISECGRVIGVVVSVDGEGLAVVDGFTLRTTAGEMLQFEIERLELADGGKSGPHLREHQRDGLLIEVEYKVEDGRLVALRYVDAG